MKYLLIVFIFSSIIFFYHRIYYNTSKSEYNPNSLKNWNSYLSNVNNKIASIFLNFNLKDEAPIGEYSKLTWYWIKMRYPREDGLSSQDEFDNLIEHENKLCDFLSKYPVIFAGTITTQGRREFYFYTDENFKFEDKIEEFVGEEATYVFQTGEKMDSDWEQYLDVLYPSENQIKQIFER